MHWLILLLRFTVAASNARCNLLLENLAVRHQLLVLHRTAKLPRLTPLDRAPWASLGVKSVATTRTQVKASDHHRPGRGQGLIDLEVFLAPLPRGPAVGRFAGPAEAFDQRMARRSHVEGGTLRFKARAVVYP